MSISARFLFSLLVLTLVFAAPSHADQILYQTSFDTDTTDVPGTYSPMEFDVQGFYLGSGTAPTDSTAFTQSGILHIHRNNGATGSANHAEPAITLSSQDLLGTAAFPSVFSVSFEMGGESGGVSWWGSKINFYNQGSTPPAIHLGMVPGCCSGSSFHMGVDPNQVDTSATGAFTPQFGTLYPIELTVNDLDNGSYQLDLSVTDPNSSITYTDSKVSIYPYAINTIGLVRSGSGSGDSIFDNLAISTPIPEPSTALLLGVGLAGLGMRRRRTRRGC